MDEVKQCRSPLSKEQTKITLSKKCQVREVLEQNFHRELDQIPL